MKNLIYKELKLAIHPICYVLAFAFPLLAFAPNYPLCVGLLYCATCYPILFLGANKGKQSNDLLYTSLLPVRKKDIVLARLISCSILIFGAMLITLLISPITSIIHNSLLESNPETYGGLENIGLGVPAIFSLFGLTLISYGIYNFIYFHFFYRDGRSIFLSTFIGLISFMILLFSLTLGLPLVFPTFDNFASSVVGNLCLGIGGLIFYIVISFLTYKHSSKELEAVDL